MNALVMQFRFSDYDRIRQILESIGGFCLLKDGREEEESGSSSDRGNLGILVQPDFFGDTAEFRVIVWANTQVTGGNRNGLRTVARLAEALKGHQSWLGA